MKTSVLKHTISLCPVCRKQIPAEYVRLDTDVVMKKTCDEHGAFQIPVWRGTAPDFLEWQRKLTADTEGLELCDLHCPGCKKHLSPPCCVVLEITKRCNLHCPFCLAGAGEDTEETLSFDTLCVQMDDLHAQGVRSLHFGGGEPTVRKDFPEIVAYAKQKGFDYLQLNTNGVRLATEEGYAGKLADAGLDNVFLQFDGTSDEIYEQTRGTKLLDIKERAIRACDKAFLGVILVPTLVPGINTEDIGNIIRFAKDHMPAVKGIHFQPVTYMGRIPDERDVPKLPHLTLPELLNAIETQTDGLLHAADLHPSVADASLCGFHGEFRKKKDGTLEALPHRVATESCCCAPGNTNPVVNADGETLDLQDAVRRSQDHVKRRWTRQKPQKDALKDSLDILLQELGDASFSVSAMAFQDVMTLDTKRMMQCTLRTYRNGTLVPFCLAHTMED